MGYLVVIVIIGMIAWGVLKDKFDTWKRARQREELARGGGQTSTISNQGTQPGINAATDAGAAERERIRLEYQRRADELRRKRAQAAGLPLPPATPAPRPTVQAPVSRATNTPSASSPSAMNQPTAKTEYRTHSHADDVRTAQDAQRRQREIIEARKTAEREAQRARELNMERERARNAATIQKNTLAQRAISARATVIAKAKSAAARAAGVAPTSRPTPTAPAPVTPATPTTPSIPGVQPRPVATTTQNRIPAGQGAIMGVSLRQAMVIKEILDPPVSMRSGHLDASGM